MDGQENKVRESEIGQWQNSVHPLGGGGGVPRKIRTKTNRVRLNHIHCSVKDLMKFRQE